MPTEATFLPPAVERSVEAFRSATGLTERQLQMLRIHYHAPMRTVTATQLAKLSGYSSYSVANAQYGRLARLVVEKLNYRPEPEQLGTLVRFEKRNGEWHWLMRAEVAQALESLGWVEGTDTLLPEEDEAVYSEGAVAYRQHRVIERDANLLSRH